MNLQSVGYTIFFWIIGYTILAALYSTSANGMLLPAAALGRLPFYMLSRFHGSWLRPDHSGSSKLDLPG
jgi:hypothetical protein